MMLGSPRAFRVRGTHPVSRPVPTRSGCVRVGWRSHGIASIGWQDGWLSVHTTREAGHSLLRHKRNRPRVRLYLPSPPPSVDDRSCNRAAGIALPGREIGSTQSGNGNSSTRSMSLIEIGISLRSWLTSHSQSGRYLPACRRAGWSGAALFLQALGQVAPGRNQLANRPMACPHWVRERHLRPDEYFSSGRSTSAWAK